MRRKEVQGCSAHKLHKLDILQQRGHGAATVIRGPHCTGALTRIDRHAGIKQQKVEILGISTFCFSNNCANYSPGVIAPVGQASAHVPQSTHASASITYLPSPSEIAPDGHSPAQEPHITQSSVIT